MKYENIVEGKFINRPNRFIAYVEVADRMETVHVKNTGRCRELLLPGNTVGIQRSDNEARKTKYDLISVYKKGSGWVNIDSQAPNKVVGEWLEKQEYDYVKPEYVYGNSRIDFYMEKGAKKYLMEVKGCTLEIDGAGYFPDAPTERGTKHLRELIKAVSEGYNCYIAFVIPMEGVKMVYPNAAMDKEFAEAFYEAQAAGVKVLNLACRVEKDELEVKNQELASANEAKKSDLQTQQTALAELQSKSKDMESIQAIADRIKGLEEESKQLEVVKQAEQGKHDAIVAETEQLVVNNAALRQLKADQDARLSPPNLKTRVSQVIHDFNVVVIDGGAADLGVVPGSKLAVMRDGNKIAELDVNAVESRVSTATILPSTVTAGERVEAGDVVVSVRP